MPAASHDAVWSRCWTPARPHPTAERPQQFHLDVTIDDMDEAERAVLAIGARKHDIHPGAAEDDSFRVCLDPAGHPFCLCWD